MIVLAGLLLPISMLVAAVLIDLLVVAWAVEEVTRRDVWPRLTGFVKAHHWAFHLPHLGVRHH
ncbi:MAG: hypothetical protein AABZ80_05875 [Gemmatimonadota bacterium]